MIGKLVYVNGHRWEIISGAILPPPNRGGRRTNETLAQLDYNAAIDVINKKYSNAREAAKAYLAEYGGEASIDWCDQQRNGRLRDITRRIEKKVNFILNS